MVVFKVATMGKCTQTQLKQGSSQKIKLVEKEWRLNTKYSVKFNLISCCIVTSLLWTLCSFRGNNHSVLEAESICSDLAMTPVFLLLVSSFWGEFCRVLMKSTSRCSTIISSPVLSSHQSPISPQPSGSSEAGHLESPPVLRNDFYIFRHGCKHGSHQRKLLVLHALGWNKLMYNHNVWVYNQWWKYPDWSSPWGLGWSRVFYPPGTTRFESGFPPPSRKLACLVGYKSWLEIPPLSGGLDWTRASLFM